ncbi:unnamed protein product [Schistosoma rodhaini]|uniref:Secreted protein n=1 Tax=Schistosoma rodhaini TaxID=6188 RepID=A0AA85EXX2_9TREM|nr:unnamed protein product [Schistosoma rodhaini]
MKFDYFVFGLILLYSDSIYGQIETTKDASVTDQGWVRFTMNHNPLIVNPRRLPQKPPRVPDEATPIKISTDKIPVNKTMKIQTDPKRYKRSSYQKDKKAKCKKLDNYL